jgi:hypothetical protein
MSAGDAIYSELYLLFSFRIYWQNQPGMKKEGKKDSICSVGFFTIPTPFWRELS